MEGNMLNRLTVVACISNVNKCNDDTTPRTITWDGTNRKPALAFSIRVDKSDFFMMHHLLIMQSTDTRKFRGWHHRTIRANKIPIMVSYLAR